MRSSARNPAATTPHLDGRVAVADVGGDALHVGDIVQRQLGHELVHLEQQRERLADAAGRAEDRHLLGLDDRHGARAAAAGAQHRRREAAARDAGGTAGGHCVIGGGAGAGGAVGPADGSVLVARPPARVLSAAPGHPPLQDPRTTPASPR